MATISNCTFCPLCAICSGNECRRKYRTPKPTTDETEDNGHDNHEHVGLTRRGYECRKIVGGSGVKLLSHRVLKVVKAYQHPTPVFEHHL